MIDYTEELPLEMLSQRDLIRRDINYAIKNRIKAFQFTDEFYNFKTLSTNARDFLRPFNSRLKTKVERRYYNKIDSVLNFSRKDYPDPKKAFEAKAALIAKNRELVEPYITKYDDYLLRCNKAIYVKQKKFNGVRTLWCIIDFELLDFCHVDHI